MAKFIFKEMLNKVPLVVEELGRWVLRYLAKAIETLGFIAFRVCLIHGNVLSHTPNKRMVSFGLLVSYSSITLLCEMEDKPLYSKQV